MKKLVDRQVAALNALCEIQNAFKHSGISEDELQKTRRAGFHGLCPWVNENSPEGRQA